tara:strand:+ start:140 stop:487 length:348 start_codon:yes stop_codon:yes gene_type:complete
MDRHDFPVIGTFYTKKEVDELIAKAVEKAVAEARAIDEESMRKHNRDATVISMILGFTTLALFVDGLLRILGIIPPFMHIDVNIIDKVTEQVKGEVLPYIKEGLTKIPKVGSRLY